jgi:hypothetical protein
MAKAKKDKQQSTKHKHKTKDRVTRTPLRSGDDLQTNKQSSIKQNNIWKMHHVRTATTS